MPRIEIIGGGISGLALGFFAKKAGLDFTMYESTQKCGGVIATEEVQSGLVHHGPHLARLSAELEEVMTTLSVDFCVAEKMNRFLLVCDKITKISPNFRQLCEIFLRIFRKKKEKYDSLGDFVHHHFGKTMANIHVQALVNGIFACDINQLDAKIALKSIYFTEKRAIYSILKKIWRKITSKQQKSRIIRPIGGFQTLIDALYEYLRENIILNHEITKISQKFEEKPQKTLTFITIPAYFVPKINGIPQEIKSLCEKIEYQTLCVATIFTSNPIKLEGIGCLSNAKSGILGVLFNSSAFAEKIHSYSIFYKNITMNEVNLWFESFFDVKITNSHNVKYKNAIPIYNADISKLINSNTGDIKVFSNYSGQISVSEIFTNAAAEIQKLVDMG